MTRLFSTLALAGTASIYMMAAPLHAEMMTFKTELKGATEVPPNDSAGKGTADISVDTDAKKITWTLSHEGLTGDPTAAHFHGPAKPGENAKPIVDITANMASGSADLTDAQLADIKNGMVYLNIHTEKYPDGEIRGQLMK